MLTVEIDKKYTNKFHPIHYHDIKFIYFFQFQIRKYVSFIKCFEWFLSYVNWFWKMLRTTLVWRYKKKRKQGFYIAILHPKKKIKIERSYLLIKSTLFWNKLLLANINVILELLPLFFYRVECIELIYSRIPQYWGRRSWRIHVTISKQLLKKIKYLIVGS